MKYGLNSAIWQLNSPYFTATQKLVADEAGAEVTVVGVRVYGNALEEASVVLADRYEILGLDEFGQLQNLRLGERLHSKALALGRSQECIDYLRVFLVKDRAGSVDELTAGSHARSRFFKHC